MAFFLALILALPASAGPLRAPLEGALSRRPAPDGGHALLKAFPAFPPAAQERFLDFAEAAATKRGLQASELAGVQERSLDLLLDMLASDSAAAAEAQSHSTRSEPPNDPQALKDRIDGLLPLLEAQGEKFGAGQLKSLLKGAEKKLAQQAPADSKTAEEKRAETLERASELVRRRANDAMFLGFEPGFEAELMSAGRHEQAGILALARELHSDRASRSRRLEMTRRLGNAASASEDPQAQALAVQAIMDAAYLHPDDMLVAESIASLEKIAERTFSPRVEGLALALLRRQLEVPREPEGMDHGKSLRQGMDRISASGRKLHEIRIPDARKPESLFAQVPTPKLGNVDQFRIMLKENGQAFAMLSAVGAFMTWYVGYTNLLLIMAAVASLYLIHKGLWRHQPWGAFANLIVAGAILSIPAYWGAGWPAMGVTAAALYAALQVARKGFKQDHSLGAAGVNIIIGVAAVAILAIMSS